MPIGSHDRDDEVSALATVERVLHDDIFDYTGPLGSHGYVTYGDFAADGTSAGGQDLETYAYIDSVEIPNDGWIEGTFYTAAPYTGISYYLSIYARQTVSASQGYWIRVWADRWRLEAYSGGGYSVIIPETNDTSQDGDVWRMELQGSLIVIKKNGGEVGRVTDSTTPGGGVWGMYTWKNTTVESRVPGRFDRLRAGDWTTSNITISNVNGNNTVTNGNSTNVVSGFLLDTATSATIKGHGDVSLSITSQTETELRTSAFDVLANNYPFGAGTNFEVSDGATPDTKAISLLPANGYDYIVGSSIDASTGLAQSGGANGDQWHWPVVVASSSLTVHEDTNFTLDQPVPEGTQFTYDLYSGAVWDSGVVTINQSDEGGGGPEPDDPATWVQDIPPTTLYAGVPAGGSVAPYAEGTAPLSYVEILQQTPDELITRSDGSWSGFAPDTTSFQMQWRVTNAVNPDGAESNLLTYAPIMPEITYPKDQRATSTGAQITVTTPSVTGRIYWVADPSASEPTGEQIESGLNAEGNAAETAGSFPITYAGQQPWQTITSGRPGVKYYYWMVQVN